MSKLWQLPLGDLIELQRGFDLPKTNFVIGSIPVIASNGILGFHNKHKVLGPGVTIGRSGTVGIPRYIKDDFFPHNTTLFVANFKNNIPQYIYYLLQTLKLHDRKSGSGVPTMNRNHLYPLVVSAYLDKDAQKKIAHVLSSLDSKIELNNRINTELEAMAKTIYDYWFVQFDFPTSKEIALAQNKPHLIGKPYKSSGGKMVWNEQLKREIPLGWMIERLDSIESNIITGKTPPTNNKDFFGNDIPFITIGDIRGNIYIIDTETKLSKLGADIQKNKFIPAGAICISCIATTGLIGFASTESQTNQQINSIVCKHEHNRYYLYFALNNYFKFSYGVKSGNTFANMNKEDFSSIAFLSPKDIMLLVKFSKILNPIMQKIFNNSNEIKHCITLRDWLLPMLMNGQVKVK